MSHTNPLPDWLTSGRGSEATNFSGLPLLGPTSGPTENATWHISSYVLGLSRVILSREIFVGKKYLGKHVSHGVQIILNLASRYLKLNKMCKSECSWPGTIPLLRLNNVLASVIGQYQFRFIQFGFFESPTEIFYICFLYQSIQAPLSLLWT